MIEEDEGAKAETGEEEEEEGEVEVEEEGGGAEPDEAEEKAHTRRNIKYASDKEEFIIEQGDTLATQQDIIDAVMCYIENAYPNVYKLCKDDIEIKMKTIRGVKSRINNILNSLADPTEENGKIVMDIETEADFILEEPAMQVVVYFRGQYGYKINSIPEMEKLYTTHKTEQEELAKAIENDRRDTQALDNAKNEAEQLLKNANRRIMAIHRDKLWGVVSKTAMGPINKLRIELRKLKTTQEFIEWKRKTESVINEQIEGSIATSIKQLNRLFQKHDFPDPAAQMLFLHLIKSPQLNPSKVDQVVAQIRHRDSDLKLPLETCFPHLTYYKEEITNASKMNPGPNAALYTLSMPSDTCAAIWKALENSGPFKEVYKEYGNSKAGVYNEQDAYSFAVTAFYPACMICDLVESTQKGDVKNSYVNATHLFKELASEFTEELALI